MFNKRGPLAHTERSVSSDHQGISLGLLSASMERHYATDPRNEVIGYHEFVALNSFFSELHVRIFCGAIISTDNNAIG